MMMIDALAGNIMAILEDHAIQIYAMRIASPAG